MPENTVSSTRYQQIAIMSFTLFTRSMRLCEELSYQAAKDPGFLKNQKVQTGLAQIIKTIDTSGRALENLPEPPYGMEVADQCFREIGMDIRTLASHLSILIDSRTNENKQHMIQSLEVQVEKVKQNFHEAILSLKQDYSKGIS